MRKRFPGSKRLTLRARVVAKLAKVLRNHSRSAGTWKRMLAVLLVLGLFRVEFIVAQAFARVPQRQQSPRAETGEASIARGQEFYKEHCAICHFSTSTAKKIGPGLKGLYSRGHYQNGRKLDDASLRRLVEHGDKEMPGLSARLRLEHLRDLIAYLKTL